MELQLLQGCGKAWGVEAQCCLTFLITLPKGPPSLCPGVWCLQALGAGQMSPVISAGPSCDGGPHLGQCI